MNFRERPRLLKKSLSARLAVQKRSEKSPKHYKQGVFSPRTGGREECEGVFQHAGSFLVQMSPNCKEGVFSEVRSGLLGVASC